MPIQRPSGSTSLPPTDHVARVLLRDGARDDAMVLLRAAIERDPGEKACGALLRAVEARPDASVWGPDLRIDMALIDAYVRRGMLLEALAVLRGSGLASEPYGRRRQQELEELLRPAPDGAGDTLREVDRQLRTGGAAVALAILEDRIAAGEQLPDWAKRRHALLSRILLDNAEIPSEDEPSSPGMAASALGRLVESRLRSRDLAGALDDARKYAAQHAADVDAKAVVAALERLTEAAGQRTSEHAIIAESVRTVPMKGHTVAEFQVRMGNLRQAARFYRKLVLDDPHDAVARQRLEDVQTLRRVLEGRTASLDPLSADDSMAGVDAAAALGAATTGERPVRKPASAPPADIAVEPTRRALSPFSDEIPGSTTMPDHGAPSADIELPRELTARARAPRAAAAEPQPPRDGLDGPTKEVAIEVPMTARKPSSPELLHKRVRRATGDSQYRPGKQPTPAHGALGDEEEESTAVLSAQLKAELLLKQGYVDRALHIYQELAAKHPERADYRQRVEAIEAMGPRSAPITEAIDATEPGPPIPDESPWEDEDPTVVSAMDEGEASTDAPPPMLADVTKADIRVEADRGAVAVHRIIVIG